MGLLFFPISLIGIFLTSQRKTKELYLLQVVPTSKILLLIVLLPIYGIWGAIFALLGALIINLGILIILFKKL
jgi:O-antigen/teichoic acid export membrane protein